MHTPGSGITCCGTKASLSLSKLMLVSLLGHGWFMFLLSRVVDDGKILVGSLYAVDVCV